MASFADEVLAKDRSQSQQEGAGGFAAAVLDRAAAKEPGRVQIDDKMASDMDRALNFAQAVTGQESLSPSNLETSTRARVGFFGDTFEEKQAAFKQAYPDGELIQVPEADLRLARRAPNEEYQLYDPGVSEAWNNGRFAIEALRDAADVSGDAPELIGEVLATAVGGLGGKLAFTGTKNLMPSLMKMMAGAFTGNQAQQEAQTLAGTQRETRGQQFERGAGEAGFSLFGGLAGSAITGTANMTRRGGMMKPTPEGEAGEAAAERLGAGGLMPQQMTDQPFLRTIGRLSSTMSGKVGQELRRQSNIVTNKLKNSSTDAGKVLNNAAAVMERENDRMKALWKRAASDPEVSWVEAAPVLKEATERWWRVDSKNYVDSLYAAARNIEEPQFNIRDLKEAAREIVRPARAKGVGGRPVTAGEAPKHVQDVAQKIIEVQPDSANIEFLRALRTDLYDATLPGAGGERAGDLTAKKLRGAISETLDSPVNANEKFVEAWSQANRAAKDRFATRETGAVMEILNSDRPISVLSGLARPGNAERLAELGRTLSPAQFGQIGEAFKHDLLKDPNNIARTLGDFDKPTLNMLLSNAEQTAFKAVDARTKELASTGVQKGLEQHSRNSAFVRSLIENPSTRGISELSRMVSRNGGQDSPFGKSIRAGIIDEVVRSARVVGERDTLSAQAVERTVQQFDQSGVLTFLPLAEQNMLRDSATVLRLVELSKSGAGESIRAAQAGSGMAEIVHGNVGAFQSALSEVLESFGIGKFLTSALGKSILVGKRTKPDVDATDLRILAASLSRMGTDTEALTDTENPNAP